MVITRLICGILAIIFSHIAKKMEPKNNLEKAGNIMGILVLALNCLALFITLYPTILMGSFFLFE